MCCCKLLTLNYLFINQLLMYYIKLYILNYVHFQLLEIIKLCYCDSLNHTPSWRDDPKKKKMLGVAVATALSGRQVDDA